MEHTLLSSNQVRANDVTLWEHPCNSYHGLSIYNPSSDHPVPLHMDGIVCFTVTRAPTDEEIRNLPHVELTSSVEWKPSEATYNLHSLGKGYVGGVLLSWASILCQVFLFPFQLPVFPILTARFPTSLQLLLLFIILK